MYVYWFFRVTRFLPRALVQAVVYFIVNDVSCVYWYLVGYISPQTPQAISDKKDDSACRTIWVCNRRFGHSFSVR